MKLIRYASSLLPILLLLANSSSSLIEKRTDKPTVLSILPVRINELSTIDPAELYNAWNLEETGLSQTAFELAHKGYTRLVSKHLVQNNCLLTIIDYSKPSSQKRLYVLDMVDGKVLFNSLVAHGRNSGQNFAKTFSNRQRSQQTSLGFYITMNTYTGENGYSLRLKGCERGINDRAYSRAIVLHGADYVSENFILRNGFLGRSYGCPAVPKELSRKIIDVIKDGSCMFLYYPSKKYSSQSKILNS